MNPKTKLGQTMTINKLLPNMMTIFGLCAGLSSIRFAMMGKWDTAVICVFVAAILDGLDGRLARLLKVQSKFGAELDSLADMISFGVAPAIVLYLWSFDVGGRFVWLGVLLFTTCMGLRLARFNSMLSNADVPYWASTNFFTGVPAPAGAGLALMPLMIFIEFEPLKILQNPYSTTAWLVFVAGLLVSKLPTFSFKGTKIPQNYILPFILLAAFLVGSLIINTSMTLIWLGVAYLSSFPFSFKHYQKLKKKHESDKGQTIIQQKDNLVSLSPSRRKRK